MDNNDEFIHEDKQPPQDFEPAQSQTVSPIRGFYWLERSLSEIYVPHFKSWFIAALVYSVITSVIPAFLPASALVLAIVNPLFVAGLLLGAHHVYKKQGEVKPLQMMAAFQHKRIAQLLLYTVAAVVFVLLATFILVAVIGFDSLKGFDLAGIEAGSEASMKAAFKIISPAIPWAILLIILIGLATWFAMSLILFSNQNAIPAIGNSLVGGLKNFFAVLVFILVLFVCAIVLMLISALVLSIFAGIIANPYVNLVLNVIINALTVPIFVGVTYIAYREIFLGDMTKSEKSL